MQVAVEYIKWLEEERAKINRQPLAAIEFFEGGMKLSIPDREIENWELTGLNNIHFITSGCYKGEPDED